MSIDINKIIQESVQNTLNEQENNDEVISLTESTNEDVKSQGKTKETNEEVYENDFDPTVASSISAGLGALTFRNHYRALKEQSQGSKLKTTGKIGAGLGAAGAAGAGGLYGLGKKSIKAAQKKYDDHSLLNRLSGVKRTEDQGITSTMKKGLGVAKDKYEELTGQ